MQPSHRPTVALCFSLLFCAAGLVAPAADAQNKKGGPKPPAKTGPSAQAPAASAPAATPPATTATPAATAPAEPTPAASGEAAAASAPPEAPKEEKKKSGWIVDGDLGLPRLKSNETSLAFDANLGWVGKSWGFGAYLSSYTYALQQDSSLNQTQRFRFGAEARYVSGEVSDPSRFEAKIELNSGAYNTTYIAIPTADGNGDSGFSTEQSTLTRLTAVASLRRQTSERFRFKVGAGLGMQTDTYFRASSGTNGSDGGAQFDAATTVRVSARGRFSHQTLPEVLSLRAELDASSFELRRIGFFAGGASTDPGALTVTTFRETDVSARLFADIERFAFLGLMPGAFVGADYISISGDRSTSALIPIFGVGIINAAPRD